jgi:hypothetical protein
MSTKITFNNSGNFNGWIHDLARAESSPEAEVLDRLTQNSGPQQAIEESTVDFLTDLRDFFQEYVRVLNTLSDGGKKFSEIKIFNLTQGAADFMLYRNGVKLIIANTAHGVIQLSYDQHKVAGAQTSQSPAVADVPQAEELLAQMGVFGSVHWTYRGEQVQSESVAQYFFSEFSRLTRDQKKSKPNQKVLLEQIKALLQEQGLSLD